MQQFRATLSLPAQQESEEENDSYSDDNIHPPLLTTNVPGQISAAELCFAMYRDQSTLGVVHICLVLTQMIAMSPSNAHTERQIKVMNNIKTIHRMFSELFGMQPFETSNVLRIKQAKENFDFILAL